MISTLTVIIPTFNNTFGLKYLLNYFKDKPYQLVIIDNKPSREKQELIRKFESLKVLKYLPQKKNLGFAAAVNLGAKYAKTNWMLILNDDVEFHYQKSNIKNQKYISKIKNKFKNKLELVKKLIKYAEKNELDAVSPILINPNGEIENCGYQVLPFGKINLIKEIPPRLPRRYVGVARDDAVAAENIDGLTAACLLIRTRVFKKLGGFDESFFAYLEDVEFFLRLPRRYVGVARDKSFGVAYDIEVLHKQMTTTKTMAGFKTKQDMINWWRLYFKHPDVFKFDLRFIIERLKNLSGYLKTVFNKDSLCNLLK